MLWVTSLLLGSFLDCVIGYQTHPVRAVQEHACPNSGGGPLSRRSWMIGTTVAAGAASSLLFPRTVFAAPSPQSSSQSLHGPHFVISIGKITSDSQSNVIPPSGMIFRKNLNGINLLTPVLIILTVPIPSGKLIDNLLVYYTINNSMQLFKFSC